MLKHQKIMNFDSYLAISILIGFMAIFIFGSLYIKSKQKWQRTEVYVLMLNSDISCYDCVAGAYANHFEFFFKIFNPEAHYSMLFPVWLKSKNQLLSYSIFSDSELKLKEIVNSISKYEKKCRTEIIQASLKSFQFENLGRLIRSEKDCRIVFVYERKL